jgi:arylformamidase
MKILLEHLATTYEVDLSQPLDISIPLVEQVEQVNCFYAPPYETFPVVAGSFVGSTAEGGLVNFLNIKLNPHGNGTHTECVGHIATEKYSIHKCLTNFHKVAKLHSVYPTMLENGDKVILKSHFETDFDEIENVDTLVIRTLPNDSGKLTRNYSGTNPTYVHHEAMDYLVNLGIKHLLIDLPSVDRESDEGLLLAHKAFWRYPTDVRSDCTITELVYVSDEIRDGLYFLNLQIASFDIDVSPSKPVLYKLVAADAKP